MAAVNSDASNVSNSTGNSDTAQPALTSAIVTISTTPTTLQAPAFPPGGGVGSQPQQAAQTGQSPRSYGSGSFSQQQRPETPPQVKISNL